MFDEVGSRRLSAFIDTDLIGSPLQSLADLSGDRQRLGPDDYRTSLIEAVEEAWHSPIRNLTCEHLRVLVSQKMGLKWISDAVAEFVELHPRVEITNYPGELALLALKALSDIAECNPRAAAQLRALDYSWMDDEFSFSSQLRREAAALLETIRH